MCKRTPPPKKKISAPFLPWELWVRKAYKLNFHWKVCGNFFSRPRLQGSKILSQSPPFCTRPPPNKCLWTVPKKHPAKWATKIFPLSKPQCCGIFNIISLKKDVYLCCHACLFTFYCDQLFPVSSLAFACFCEFLYVAYSAVDVCFVLYHTCLHFRQPDRCFCSYEFFAFPRNRT